MGVDAWALLVSIVALLGAGLGWVFARRDAADAKAEAARAAKAAEDSAAAAKRSADALEQQVALATPPDIAFEIEVISGNRVQLVNTGQTTATNVTIDENQFGHGRQVPHGVTLRRNQGVEFLVFGSFGSPIPGTVEVTCAELADPVHVRMPKIT